VFIFLSASAFLVNTKTERHEDTKLILLD